MPDFIYVNIYLNIFIIIYIIINLNIYVNINILRFIPSVIFRRSHLQIPHFFSAKQTRHAELRSSFTGNPGMHQTWGLLEQAFRLQKNVEFTGKSGKKKKEHPTRA